MACGNYSSIADVDNIISEINQLKQKENDIRINDKFKYDPNSPALPEHLVDFYYEQQAVAYKLSKFLEEGINKLVIEKKDDINKFELACNKGTYIHELFNEYSEFVMSRIGLKKGNDYALADKFQAKIDLQFHFCCAQFDLKPSDISEDEGKIHFLYGRDKEVRNTEKLDYPLNTSKYYEENGKTYERGQLARYQNDMSKEGKSYETYVITYNRNR